jgi:hypothetical protein
MVQLTVGLSGATHGQTGRFVGEDQHRMDVCVVRVKATPASAFELLQVALELVDGLLFWPPDEVPKALNIRGDIAR